MAQNVIITTFEVESEGYQALTELKRYASSEDSFITQAVLVKKENGALRTLDGFDTGINTTDDTAIGEMVGALLGILGGPIGVLLGGSYGALIGSSLDAGDALDDASLIEQIAQKMLDGDVAIVALAEEEDETLLDKELSRFKGTIIRYDAAVVEAEVEEAIEMEKEMARLARKELRDEKKAARQEKIAEKKEKIASDFAAIKEKIKKED